MQVIAYDFTGNSIPKGAHEFESIGLRIHFITAWLWSCQSNNVAWWWHQQEKDSFSVTFAIPHPVALERTLEFIPDPVRALYRAGYRTLCLSCQIGSLVSGVWTPTSCTQLTWQDKSRLNRWFRALQNFKGGQYSTRRKSPIPRRTYCNNL